MEAYNGEIKTIRQLDEFINYLVNNKIYYLSPESYPSMTPEIKGLYILYTQALQATNVEDSLKLFTTILSYAPNFVAARYNFATIMNKQGNLEEALHQYQIAAQYNPSDPTIFIGLGSVLSGLGKNEKAIETYLHILKTTSVEDLSGSNLTVRWMAMLNLGTTYRSIQKYRESLEWLDLALSWIKKHEKLALFGNAWDNELITTYLELGNLYRELSNNPKSEEMYLTGVKIGEKDKSPGTELRRDETLIWLNLGELYLEMKQWNNAEYFLKKCLARHPNEKYFQVLLTNAQNKVFGR